MLKYFNAKMCGLTLIILLAVGPAWGADVTMYALLWNTSTAAIVTGNNSDANVVVRYRAGAWPDAANGSNGAGLETVMTVLEAAVPTTAHTLYIWAGTYDDDLDFLFIDHANTQGITITGQGRLLTKITSAIAHPLYGETVDNAVISNIAFIPHGTTRAFYKSDGCTGWVISDCDFVSASDHGAQNLTESVGNHIIFNRCGFYRKYAYGDSSFSVWTGWAASVDLNYCIVAPSPYAPTGGGLWLAGSGTSSINNTLILGAPSHGVYATVGTVNVKNSVIQSGMYNAAARTIYNDGATITVDSSYAIGPMWEGDSLWSEGVIGGTYQTTNLYSKFRSPRGGYILPRVDDSSAFAYAQSVATVLQTYGKKGTYNIDNASWNGANTAALQAMRTSGVMDIGSQTRTHTDLAFTGKIFDVTKAAETITIDRAAETITLSGGGSVGTFKSKTLAQIKTALEALGATVTPVAAYNSGAAGQIAASAKGEVIANGAATNQIDALIDATAATGLFKSELVDSKSEIETLVGSSFICDSFGAPFNSFSADARAAIMAAGFTSASGSLTGETWPVNVQHLNDVNLYDLGCFTTATYLKGSNEANTRLNARAIGWAVVMNGLVLPVLAHSDSDLTAAQWGYVLDEWSQIPGLIVTSYREAAALIRASHTDDTDGTFSKTFAVENYQTTTGSPLRGTGEAVTGLHTASNTDVDMGPYEAGCVKESLPGKIWSDYPPITGTITGGDYSGNTHIYNCR